MKSPNTQYCHQVENCGNEDYEKISHNRHLKPEYPDQDDEHDDNGEYSPRKSADLKVFAKPGRVCIFTMSK